MRRPTVDAAKEFCRDLLGTVGHNNPMSVKTIAAKMGIEYDKALNFCIVAKRSGFMSTDNYNLPSYMLFPTLYKVNVNAISGGKRNESEELD